MRLDIEAELKRLQRVGIKKEIDCPTVPRPGVPAFALVPSSYRKNPYTPSPHSRILKHDCKE